MANMAYFNGSQDTTLYTALSVPASHFDWGTGDFKFSFKVITTQVPEAGTNRIITWDRIVIAETGVIGVASSGGGLVSTTAINDGIEHTIAVERISGRLAISIDGTESSHEDSDTFDWTIGGGGNIIIGVSAGMPPNTYEGLLGEFKIYKGSGGSQTLELDLPLVSDVIDISPNGLIVTALRVLFLEPSVVTTLEPQILNTLDDAEHGVTGDVFLTDTTGIFGQDINVTGYASAMNTFESALVFTANIPSGATIVEAFLLGYGIDLGGFSDAGVKCRITLENNLNPSQWTTYADYATRRANIGTAFVDWDGATISHSNWNKSPELKTLIQELVNIGEIQKLSFFLNDNGSSDMNAYGFGSGAGINGFKLWVTYQEPIANPFISKWNIPSDSFSIHPVLTSTGTYDFTVDWGDLTPTDHITAWNDLAATHVYATAGEYTVTITGIIEGINFSTCVTAENIIEISQWGNLKLGNDGWYFCNCSNLIITATDSLDLSETTNFNNFFYGCTSLTTVPNISSWVTSNVTDISYMFGGASVFNQDISGWDVSNVTNMSYLFFATTLFNQDISGWDVSNVTDMSAMFYVASAFNQDISGWDVSSVTNMSDMFSYAGVFNQDISGWNVSNVTSMSGMFSDAYEFNQDIGGWDTTSVIDMSYMFIETTSFNQDISNWDVSKVTTMHRMFEGASSFSKENYSLFLISASSQAVQTGVDLDAQSTQYLPSASASRSNLIDVHGWTINDAGISGYSVTYNSNGGGGTLTDPNSPYAPSSTVTVLSNTFVRLGYRFDKWNTQSGGGGTNYNAGNTFTISSDTILYAQWIAKYTVDYNANGGTGTPPVDTLSPYDAGSTVTVKPNTNLAKTGRTFRTWNTQADGEGTDYNPLGTFIINSSTTLYAIYSGRKYYKNDVTNNVVDGNRNTYWCLQDHTGNPDTEPGVGINWETYWGCGVDLSVKTDKVSTYPDPSGYIATFDSDGNIIVSDRQVSTDVPPDPTAENDFIVGGSDSTSFIWLKKTLEETKEILGVGSAVHNNLEGLQGGDSTSSEYYHLTENDYDALTDVNAQLVELQTDGDPLFKTLTIKSTAETESAPLGDELLSASGWTSTGWTGDWASGFKHTVGNTTALLNSLPAVIENMYEIVITHNATVGNLVITFGGIESLPKYYNQQPIAAAFVAITIDSLIITPSSDFDGTIFVSTKQVTEGYDAVEIIKNSSGNNTIEIRSSASETNKFIGNNAGMYTLIHPNPLLIYGTENMAIGTDALKYCGLGYRNIAIGNQALKNCVGGYGNTAIGNNSQTAMQHFYGNASLGDNTLPANVGGSYNCAFGYMTLYLLTDGDYNCGFGYRVLGSLLTGNSNLGFGNGALRGLINASNNIGIGYYAGRYISSGTVANESASYSIYIGNQTRAQASGNSYEIVIGYNLIGNGSNTVTIGTSSCIGWYKGSTLMVDQEVTTVSSPTFNTTTSNLTLPDTGKITIDTSPASDHTATGIISSETAGENVVFGEVCYLKSDGKNWKSDANAESTMPVLKMAIASITANNSGLFLSYGVVRDDSWTWTIGGYIYASTVTGGLTQTAPNGEGDQIQIVGLALSATTIFFNPTLDTMEIGLDIVDKPTGYAITWSELTRTPKTFICDSDTDQNFTFSTVPAASDVGKTFRIQKSLAGAGKVTITAPTGVYIDDSTVSGTIYCRDSARASLTLELVTATQLSIVSSHGTWTTT